jgi:hypothetical protein
MLKISKPPGVAVDELFYLKVQIQDDSLSQMDMYNRGGVPPEQHLVYDETRKCQFMIEKGTPGFTELKAVVKRDVGCLFWIRILHSKMRLDRTIGWLKPSIRVMSQRLSPVSTILPVLS